MLYKPLGQTVAGPVEGGVDGGLDGGLLGGVLGGAVGGDVGGFSPPSSGQSGGGVPEVGGVPVGLARTAAANARIMTE